MKKIHILLLIIWMIVIFMFSHESGVTSTNRSEKIASTVVSNSNNNNVSNGNNTSNKAKEESIVKKYERVIRKCSHLLEYTILGILAILVVKDYMKLNLKICLFVLLFVFLYACSDELHQYFIPGRDSNIIDILIDTIGGFVGIFSYYFIFRKKENKNT